MRICVRAARAPRDTIRTMDTRHLCSFIYRSAPRPPHAQSRAGRQCTPTRSGSSAHQHINHHHSTRPRARLFPPRHLFTCGVAGLPAAPPPPPPHHHRIHAPSPAAAGWRAPCHHRAPHARRSRAPAIRTLPLAHGRRARLALPPPPRRPFSMPCQHHAAPSTMPCPLPPPSSLPSGRGKAAEAMHPTPATPCRRLLSSHIHGMSPRAPLLARIPLAISRAMASSSSRHATSPPRLGTRHAAHARSTMHTRPNSLPRAGQPLSSSHAAARSAYHDAHDAAPGLLLAVAGPLPSTRRHAHATLISLARSLARPSSLAAKRRRHTRQSRSHATSPPTAAP